MAQRGASAGIAAPLSTGSPNTLRMRPSAAEPTGTEMGPPASTASDPRTTPSVLDIATARTWLRPMCCCTSATTRTGAPVSDRPTISSALYNSGRCSASNSTSSTGPMIWATLPTFLMAVAVMGRESRVDLALQRSGAADDFGDFLRDRRLARPVVGPPQHGEHVAGVVGRILHRGSACR